MRHNKEDMADAEEWTLIYKDVQEELQKCKEQIDKRNKMASKGTDVTKLNATIRKQLQNIELDVNDLKSVLPKLKHEISQNDITRRKDDCDHLILQKNDLQKLFLKRITSDLHSQPAMPSYQRGETYEEDEHMKSMETSQIVDYQRDVMKKQDEGLDRISAALDRTKAIGLSISDELDGQNKLLEKLDDEVDGTGRNLKKQTNRVASLIKRSSITCGVLTIIAQIIILIILIIVLIVTI